MTQNCAVHRIITTILAVVNIVVGVVVVVAVEEVKIGSIKDVVAAVVIIEVIAFVFVRVQYSNK